jgi:hypothetical protein
VVVLCVRHLPVIFFLGIQRIVVHWDEALLHMHPSRCQRPEKGSGLYSNLTVQVYTDVIITLALLT